MTRSLAVTILLTVLVAAPAAQARKVFLNGVDITDVRGQTFKGATVTIESNGDLKIDAPAYKVEVVEPEAPAAPSGKGGPNASLTKRYYLVTQPSPEGRAQYDFVLSVNGIDQKHVTAGSPQVIVEISAWLHAGENSIEIKGTKNLAEGRKSSSPTDQVQVLIGVGHEEGKTVKIDSVKARVKANASQLSVVRKHFVLIAQ